MKIEQISECCEKGFEQHKWLFEDAEIEHSGNIEVKSSFDALWARMIKKEKAIKNFFTHKEEII